jgi:hypothetical protein
LSASRQALTASDGGRRSPARRSVAGQRARLHYRPRDAARCGRCTPVAPDDLPESGPRRAVDAARAATHIRLAAVRQRDGDRGDQPPHGPQFIKRHQDGLSPPDPAGYHHWRRGDGQDLRQRAVISRYDEGPRSWIGYIADLAAQSTLPSCTFVLACAIWIRAASAPRCERGICSRPMLLCVARWQFNLTYRMVGKACHSPVAAAAGSSHGSWGIASSARLPSPRLKCRKRPSSRARTPGPRGRWARRVDGDAVRAGFHRLLARAVRRSLGTPACYARRDQDRDLCGERACRGSSFAYRQAFAECRGASCRCRCARRR